MDYIIENIFFMSLCTFMLILISIGYIKTIRSGQVLSKHRHNNMKRYYGPVFVTIVLAVAYFESRVLALSIHATLYIAVYLMLLFVIHAHRIITTEKGFFFRGRFIEWSSIVELSGENSRVLKMRKLTMIHMDIEIRDLEDKDKFLEIAHRNINCHLNTVI